MNKKSIEIPNPNQQLRGFRIRNGHTLKEVEFVTGIDSSTISRIERGTRGFGKHASILGSYKNGSFNKLIEEYRSNNIYIKIKKPKDEKFCLFKYIKDKFIKYIWNF